MKKKRPINVEDLWAVQRPASPSLSPDGSQAVAAVTRYDMEENKGLTHLWLLSTFGGAARELTTCGEKDGQPRWSPDGKWIAFTARRGSGKDADEEAQLHLIAPDGGEAQRVTTLSTGVASIKWFADSSKIAFISWVWPEFTTEREQARELRKRKEEKCKAHVVEHTCYRFWDHWLSDGRVPCVHIVDVKTGRCRNLFAGSGYQLPVFDPGVADFDISPDGKFIAFNFNPNEDRRGDQPYQIVELPIKGGKGRVLTQGSRLAHFAPAYAPDGASIALLVCDYRRSIDDHLKLAMIDRKSGKLRRITHWDRNINPPLKWAADSSGVHFTADEYGRVGVWRQSLTAKTPVLLVRGGTVSDFDLGANQIVFVRNSMSSAPKVFATDIDGHGEHAIEDFNDALMNQLRMGEVREFSVPGWKREPVQMWAIYPPDFDPAKKWPLVHNIHGGPHANWGDHFHFRWNNQVFAAAGYVVICVNYHGSLGWGNRFLESNNGTWGTKEHADIEAGTDFMLKQGYIDGNRLAATGGSYGGKMVAWMNGRNGKRGAGKGGDRYRAYICHAGCYDWVSMFGDDAGYYHRYQLQATYWEQPEKFAGQNPLTYTKYMKTPTLVMHGALDYRVPDTQGFAYYNALKALDVPARLVHFPDENHWILQPQNSRFWYGEYFAWLKKYIGKGAGKQNGRK